MNWEITKTFLANLSTPGFRGLIVFRSLPEMRTWLEMYTEIFLRSGGKYKTTNRSWEFPCGSSFRVDYSSNIELKTRGMVFSHIEIDGSIEPQIRDVIMTRKRIVI